MAVPTQVEMPSYIIYRESELGQPIDPKIPLAFFPPNGSDELFDALRAKYPHVNSHSERVREAVIEFLLQETQLDQTPAQQMSAVNPATTSPMDTTFTSFSSNTSTWSSPEIPGLVPCSSYTSSPPQPMSRQFSIATPSEASPPALKQMTGVFSLSDSTQPKQRIRRKMTEQEKIEYRKRRIVKACDKCSKRKRKCNHNQQELETVPNKSSKNLRSGSTSTSRKPTAPDVPNIAGLDGIFTANPLQFNDAFGSDLIQPFDDMSDLLELPLPDMNFENILSPHGQWPWTHNADFTLMDSNGDSFATTPVTPSDQQQDFSLQQPMLFGEIGPVANYDMNQFSYANGNTAIDMNRNAATREPLSGSLLTESQYSSRTTHLQDTNGQPRFVTENANVQLDRDGEQEDSCAVNHNKQPDQRSCGAEKVEQEISFIHSNRRSRGDGRQTTHSEAVQQRLNGAANAHVEQQELVEAVKRYGDDKADQTRPRTTVPTQNLDYDTLGDLQTPLRRAKRITRDSDANMITQNANSTTMNLDDGSLSDIQTSLRRVTKRSETTEPNTVKHSGSEQQGGNQPQNQQHVPTATQSSHPLSLGELGGRLSTNTRPSTELFMLRRRIPNALHSILDRSNAPNPLRTPLPLQMSTPLQINPPRPEDSAMHTERLSDHVRRRDHFGRTLATANASGLQVLSAVAGLGCLLLLLALLPRHTTNLSLLLLAMASPVRGSKGTHLPRASRLCSEMWGTLVSGIGKSDGWEVDRVGQMVKNTLLECRHSSSSTLIREDGHAVQGYLRGPQSGKKEGASGGARGC